MEHICESCGKPCKGVWVDYGIGVHEFWGTIYNDVDKQYVSNCCEHPLELRDPEEY